MENFEFKKSIILILGIIYSVWGYIWSFMITYSVLDNSVLLKSSGAKFRKRKCNSCSIQKALQTAEVMNGIPAHPRASLSFQAHLGHTCGHNSENPNFSFWRNNVAEAILQIYLLLKLFALAGFFLPDPSWIFLLFPIPLQ